MTGEIMSGSLLVASQDVADRGIISRLEKVYSGPLKFQIEFSHM